MTNFVEQIKRIYDTDSNKVGVGIYSPYDWERLEFIAMLPIHGDVLDAGCGNGALLHLLSNQKRIRSVTGIDIHKNSKLNIPVSALYNIDDVTKLSYEDSSFDSVICMEVIEHLEIPHVSKALNNLRRVSRDFNFYTVPFNESEPVWWHDKPGGHRQNFSLEKIRELFPNSISTYLNNHTHNWILICETKNNPFSNFQIVDNIDFKNTILDLVINQ